VTTPFTWRDGERTIVFGRGQVEGALEHLGSGYVLLTTKRAAEAAPHVADAADERHDVPDGFVDELAGNLLESVGVTDSDLIVALGGGRVIDTAKALGAELGRPVAAIPTTLSAAEMTWVHRRARGGDPQAAPARPRIVVNDPALSASQPTAELAASSANALAHAVEAPLTTLTSPVPTLCAQEATRLVASAWEDEANPDRDALALAALLSGYAIDGAWYGLSHVCSQTLVRVGGAGHGAANANVLPHTTAALRRRFPEKLAALDAAAGQPIEALAARLAQLAGATQARELGVSEDKLDACADAAAQRPELDLTPPRATRDELREKIYAAAW
jgi:alcohol dehydrogenase class IV